MTQESDKGKEIIDQEKENHAFSSMIKRDRSVSSLNKLDDESVKRPKMQDYVKLCENVESLSI